VTARRREVSLVQPEGTPLSPLVCAFRQEALQASGEFRLRSDQVAQSRALAADDVGQGLRHQLGARCPVFVIANGVEGPLPPRILVGDTGGGYLSVVNNGRSEEAGLSQRHVNIERLAFQAQRFCVSFRANLLAEYRPMNGMDEIPDSELTLMIRPCFRC